MHGGGWRATFVWGHLSEQLGLLTRAVFLGPIFVTQIVLERQLVDLGEMMHRRHRAGTCFPRSALLLNGPEGELAPRIHLPWTVCPSPPCAFSIAPLTSFSPITARDNHNAHRIGPAQCTGRPEMPGPRCGLRRRSLGLLGPWQQQQKHPSP